MTQKINCTLFNTYIGLSQVNLSFSASTFIHSIWFEAKIFTRTKDTPAQDCTRCNRPHKNFTKTNVQGTNISITLQQETF